MALSGVDTGLVVGQFIVGFVDGVDANDEPDMVGARGTFEFAPAINYVPVPLGDPNPFTLLRDPFLAVLDDEGYLCTPDPDFPTKPGKRGLRLFATDSPTSSVKDWTWKVTPRFVNNMGMPIASYIAPFDIAVPTNGIVDLATAVKIPSSVGLGTEQVVVYATQAQDAAKYAARQAEYAAEEASSAGISAWEATDIAQQAMAVSELAEAVAKGVQKQAEDGEFVPNITVKVNTVANPADDVWMSDIIKNSPLVSTTLREVFPTSMQGAKGDKGGWDTGTDLGTADLDTVTAPGLYKSSVAANVTADRHYPIVGAQGTGVLEVMWQGGTASQSRLQRYTIVWGASTGKVVFVRTYTSSSWGPWNVLASQRIDNTAGRAVYTWDYTNGTGKEQLIYGDTGWRTVDSLLSPKFIPNTGSGRVAIRRINYDVHLILRIQASAELVAQNVARNSLQALMDIPLGFREYPSSYGAAMTGTAMLGSYFEVLGIGAVNAPELLKIMGSSSQVWRSTEVISANLTWNTSDPWPTTLPGAAFGTIPNL